MSLSHPFRETRTVDFAWHEVTGAVGDSVTVLPIVIAIAVLTELSVALMLIWFGVFQVVWGLYYGVPLSVEPMKALAALVLAGTVTTGEFLVAGLLLGGVLVLAGATRTITRIQRYIGEPVVRGVQFGVALVLLETGVGLGLEHVLLSGGVALVALLAIAGGHGRVTPILVLGVGALVAGLETGLPSPVIPGAAGLVQFGVADLTVPALEAAVGQVAMTVGNAALVTSILLADYFDRDVSPDRLAGSMGVMNLAAVPLGGLPMCHGSGGVAGKYAFGARTAGANVILGLGYVVVAIFAVELVRAFPMAVLGVLLVGIAGQMAQTAVERTDAYPFVLGVGALGLLTNLGVAFLAGALAYQVRARLESA